MPTEEKNDGLEKISGTVEGLIYQNEENGYEEIAIFKDGVTL